MCIKTKNHNDTKEKKEQRKLQEYIAGYKIERQYGTLDIKECVRGLIFAQINNN